MTRAIVKGFKKLIIVPRDPASFTRSSTAYNPETGELVEANVPRYVDGPFSGSKALLVEEGTTNLVANENGRLVGVSGGGASPPTVTLETVADNPFGSEAWKVVFPAGVAGYWVSRVTNEGNEWDMTSPNHYSMTLWLKGADSNLYVYPTGTSGLAQMLPTGNTIGDWVEYGVNDVTPPTGKYHFAIRPYVAYESPHTFYIAVGQAEMKPYATTFHPGTRSPELLTIPTAGVLSFDEGTIELRFKPSQGFFQDGPGYQRIIGHASSINTDEIELMRNGTTSGVSFAISNHEGQAQGGWSNLKSTTNLVVDTWYHIAVRWSFADETYAIFVNGVKESEKALSETYKPSVAGVTAIGYHPNAVGRHCDSAISDLRISSKARSDEEILAAYQSGQPLPVDEWTTLKVPFDASLAGYGPGYVYVPSNKTRVVGGPRRTKAVLLSRS